MPLVVVGDAPYGPEYMKQLKSLGNERVLFAGRVNDQAKLNGLYQGAYLYIHGHEVGGTNPSLLRAMDAGIAPVVLNVPFNASVVKDSGVVFEKDEGSLVSVLQRLEANPAEVRRLGQSASARSLKDFSWDAVAADHHELFARLAPERAVMTPAPEAKIS